MRRDPTVQATASFADDTSGTFPGEVWDARVPLHLGVAELEARERRVESRIRKMDHRRVLTPAESVLAIQLKKVRLAVKDRLDDLRAGPGAGDKRPRRPRPAPTGDPRIRRAKAFGDGDRARRGAGAPARLPSPARIAPWAFDRAVPSD